MFFQTFFGQKGGACYTRMHAIIWYVKTQVNSNFIFLSVVVCKHYKPTHVLNLKDLGLKSIISSQVDVSFIYYREITHTAVLPMITCGFRRMEKNLIARVNNSLV